MKCEKQEILISSRPDSKTQPNFSGTICSYALLEDTLTSNAQAGTSFVVMFGTTEGQLIHMHKNFDLKGPPLDTSPTKDLEIWCINPVYSGKGFIVAGNSKKLLMYEDNGKDTRNPYIKSDRPIQNKAFEGINVNALCQPHEDYLIAGLKDGRLIKIKLTTEKTGGGEAYEFSNLIYPFHNATIHDLDVAVMKPLIATCSSDKTVKVWNYETKALETEKTFDEEARIVSFHPSGFHLAVVFINKIRLLNVLMAGKGLEVFHELNDKQCTGIAYSNGGQYFAVAKNSTVHIYSSYTGENLSNMTLKDEGSIITKIRWEQDDFRLYTASREGKIIEWNFDVDKSERLTVNKVLVQNNSKLGNSFDLTCFSNKDQEENCLVINSVNEVSSGGAGHGLGNHPTKVEEQGIVTVKLKKDDPKSREKDPLNDTRKELKFDSIFRKTGSRISAVRFSNNNQVLMLGTGQLGVSQPGVLRIYQYPLTGHVHELQIHSRAITKIVVSRTDSMVFTIGEDNLISIVRLNWPRDPGVIKPLFADEYLYNKIDYIEQSEENASLNRKLKETQERTKRDNEEVKQRKVKKDMDLSRQKEEEKRLGEYRISEMHKSIAQMEKEYDDKMAKLKADNDRMIKAMEKANDERIESEGQKYEIKNKAKEELEKSYKVKFDALKEQQSLEIRRKIEENERILRVEQAKRAALEQEMIDITEIHKKSIKGIESKADVDIDNLRREYDMTIKNLTMENEKQSNSLKKAIHECSDEENSNLKSEETLKNLAREIGDTSSSIATEKTRKKNLENDIEEREETIRKKNDRIKELERKKQELEKFKFVLKYKINELRRDIGPREQDIAKMKEQLEVMKSETKEFKRTNGHLLLFVNEFELQLKGIKNEIIEQEKKISESGAYINAYECEVSELCKMADKGHEKDVKKKLIEIYNKYSTNDKKLADMNIDKQQKMIKQR